MVSRASCVQPSTYTLLCIFILFYGRVSQGLLAAMRAELWTRLKQVRPQYLYKESSHSFTDDEVLSCFVRPCGRLSDPPEQNGGVEAGKRQVVYQ